MTEDAPESPAPIEAASRAEAPPDSASAPPVAPAAERPPTPDRPPRDIPFYYPLLLVPLLLYFGSLMVPIAQRLDAGLRFPFDLDGEEGFVYNQAASIYVGHSIYSPIEREPYLVGNYPPIFPWIVSRMISPERNGIVLGRMAVAGASLLVVQLLILTAFFRTGRILPALLAPLLFLISYEFHHWSAFCRVDLPALAFTLLGLCVFLNVRSRWGAPAAAVAFVLAAFTRQTAILAPIACCLSMALFDRKRLAWFLVPYLGLGLGAFLLFNAWTEGQFYLHLVAYNKNEMSWTQLSAVMRNEIWHFYQAWIAALVAGAGFLLFVRRMKDEGDDPPKLRFVEYPHARGTVGIYLALSAASLLSFAKIGSAPNYALEPLAVAALFGVESMARLWDYGGGGDTNRRMWARLGALAMGAAALVHAFHVRRVEGDMFSSRNPNAADLADARTALSLVQRSSGKVLSEFPMFLIMSGKDVLFQPFIMSRLALEGKWDEKKIIDPIRAHEFSMIVTGRDLREVDRGAQFDRFTRPMAQAIVDNYKLGYALASRNPRGIRQPYFIWIPDPEKNKRPARKETLNISETRRGTQRTEGT